jgi:DNA-binding response OmpR family regulator
MFKDWLKIKRTSSGDNGSHSVVVISDDSAMLSLINTTLTEKNYRVGSTMDVAETLFLLDTNTPDLLICDFTRPEVEGKQLLESARLRLGKSAMPVVLFLRDSQEDETVALKLGVDDLMLKPFEAIAFLARIEQLVMKRGSAAKV